MSKKGGYLIIDLENIDLLSQINSFSVEKVKTLYELIERNYHKNVLISGIKINGIEKNDCITIIDKYFEGTANVFTFKIYGMCIGVVSMPNNKYSLMLLNTGLTRISGLTDATGVIKINYIDFPYYDNLYLGISYAEGAIAVKFNVMSSSTFRNYVIYNDGTIKIVLNSDETEYYTLTVTGISGNIFDYEIDYLG